MEDRELLELAAKALGGKFSQGTSKHRTGEAWDEWEWIGPIGISVDGITIFPHTDDGHCARMEADLKLNVEWCGTFVLVADSEGRARCSEHFLSHEEDQAARRMASLRVAAEIGKQMP